MTVLDTDLKKSVFALHRVDHKGNIRERTSRILSENCRSLSIFSM
ncbi:hypothetical protein VHARVF571_500039 [Vibrio harveyi]|nr:hypothetical protein VHARVF571_500039 [Vibrio harveyi]